MDFKLSVSHARKFEDNGKVVRPFFSFLFIDRMSHHKTPGRTKERKRIAAVTRLAIFVICPKAFILLRHLEQVQLTKPYVNTAGYRPFLIRITPAHDSRQSTIKFSFFSSFFLSFSVYNIILSKRESGVCICSNPTRCGSSASASARQSAPTSHATQKSKLSSFFRRVV